MTKVVRLHQIDADVLKLKDIPLEEPKDNEVRICVKAIALNRADIIFEKSIHTNRMINKYSTIFSKNKNAISRYYQFASRILRSNYSFRKRIINKRSPSNYRAIAPRLSMRRQ